MMEKAKPPAAAQLHDANTAESDPTLAIPPNTDIDYTNTHKHIFL
jgi:hypothetical protein